MRYLSGGKLEYIGRRDSQIKIRGFRIELTEIEEVIRRFSGIKDAVVTALARPSGEKYLVAYVTSGEIIDTAALSSFIRQEKPPYMVPAVIMQLDALPYNQNHKVNRRALPLPKMQKRAVKQPETSTQKKIFDCVGELIAHTDFGIDTNLFDAGLTSIGLLKLNSMLSKAFALPTKVSDIVENPTIEAIAKRIDYAEYLVKEQESKASATAPQMKKYPLMHNQLGILLACKLDKSTVKYNIPLLFKMSPKLDVRKLKNAIGEAINAHPYLKAILAVDNQGEPYLLRQDEAKVNVREITVTALPPQKELLRPFTLLGGCLYRAEIYTIADAKYLFFDVHHILCDGVSLTIFFRDVKKAFEGGKLTGESFTGFEAALEEQNLRKSHYYEEAAKYFQKLLSGCSTDCLPEKCPAKQGAGDVAYFLRQWEVDSQAINNFCQEHMFTPASFFNAVFAYTLSQFTHADELTYCTIYNGRSDSRTLDSVTMLAKTMPVNCVVEPQTSVLDFIEATQKQIAYSMSYDFYSFIEICSKYGLKPDIFFNYKGDIYPFLGDSFTEGYLAEYKIELVPMLLTEAKAPLAVEVSLEQGVYYGEVTYRSDYYCEDFISVLWQSLNAVARAFLKVQRLSAVALLPAQVELPFPELNANEREIAPQAAHTLIEAWAEQEPSKVALKTAQTAVTYGELEDAANAIANALLAKGVAKGELVAILLERSELFPLVELAILKAGCAFLPLLPTYPDERIEYCLSDAKVRFVLTSAEIIAMRKELFAPKKNYAPLDVALLLATKDTKRPNISITAEQIAYCIYTSGTTGVPKGVLIEQRSLANYVQFSAQRDIMANGTTIFAMASFSFDMSLSDTFLGLCLGKTVYIASEKEIHNIDLLVDAFRKEGIDILLTTPSFLWHLLTVIENATTPLKQLRGVAIGAEAFQPKLLSTLKQLNPEMVVQNSYGPTECTMTCIAKNLQVGDNITLGRPYPNIKLYVMDASGHFLPRYAVGELIICGDCVARGYLNLPDKNLAAFTTISGMRAYRSGDLVRVNGDNEVEFYGRLDSQVKLRGFRVELGEVEAVMQSFPGITQSKVIVRNNGTEDYLVGYYIAQRNIDVRELSAYLKTKLAHYMVPAAMMQLTQMPLTINGKINKKELPEVTLVRKQKKKRLAQKSLEEKIVELFRSVLGLAEVYANDNFFELGGTSLSAANVVMQLKSAGYAIEYQDIFDQESAGELASFLEGKQIASHKEKDKEYSLAPHQKASLLDTLKYNTLANAAKVERKPLGDVLLTGATGFLGMHILRELLLQEKGHITCLVRQGNFTDAISRIKTMLFYYFGDDFAQAFAMRLTVCEGDITDSNLTSLVADLSCDTIINCAAVVKHYASDNFIERTNVEGVRNLLAVAKAKDATLIQISTTSIPGVHTEETYGRNLTMPEHQLFVIDDMHNQYLQSKYQAELLLLAAIQDGVKGKIIRVGNLTGRHTDGAFQINMRTNAFMNGLRGFVCMGKCPISHATDPIYFSPIDYTAKAVVLLAGTNAMFTVFHADSRYSCDEMQVIMALNRQGFSVQPVPDEEYYEEFQRRLGDPTENTKLSGLLTNDRPDLHAVKTDNCFTANVLYRLGFAWPLLDEAYLDKVIRSMATLGFFEGCGE